jgi:hypothetical protein
MDASPSKCLNEGIVNAQVQQFASGLRGPAIHLGISLAGYAILAIAQLYAFSQMVLFAADRHGLFKLAVGGTTGAFLLFTLISLFRQSQLMLFAYGGAAVIARRI